VWDYQEAKVLKVRRLWVFVVLLCRYTIHQYRLDHLMLYWCGVMTDDQHGPVCVPSSPLFLPQAAVAPLFHRYTQENQYDPWCLAMLEVYPRLRACVVAVMKSNLPSMMSPHVLGDVMIIE
jgi:hypothetical protein